MKRKPPFFQQRSQRLYRKKAVLHIALIRKTPLEWLVRDMFADRDPVSDAPHRN